MTYASPDDVAVALGRPTDSVTPEQAAQWQVWLDAAERSVVRAFRRAGLDLTASIAAGDPTADDVADVEVAAAVRKAQNPMWGRTSETRSLDDGQVTYRNESGSTADPLDLLPSEIEGLLPAGRGRRSTAFSVMPS